MQAFETVDQAADSASAMLQEGERLSRLWRYVFVQMLDDYTSVLRHAGVPAAALEIIGRDGPTRCPMRRLAAAFGSDAGRHMCYCKQKPNANDNDTHWLKCRVAGVGSLPVLPSDARPR